MDFIQWHRCYKLYDCTRFSLSLEDLDLTSTRRITVPLIRLLVKASSIKINHPYLGPVFFNPGGPGDPGISAMLSRGHLLHIIIGKNHGLISFDPRGVELAELKIDCWS